LICAGLLQSGSKIDSFAIIIKIALARETATLKRFGEYKNSIPLGASSGEDVATEYIIIGAYSMKETIFLVILSWPY
jgi:hypothetical protein